MENLHGTREDYLNDQAEIDYEKRIEIQEKMNLKESKKVKKQIEKSWDKLPYAIKELYNKLDKQGLLHEFNDILRYCLVTKQEISELRKENNKELKYSGNADCRYSSDKEYIENWIACTEYFCKFKGEYYDLERFGLNKQKTR